MRVARWPWHRAVRGWLAAGLMLLLAACATPTAMQGTGAAGELSRAGRFALTTTDSNGQQNAVQGGFSWLDDGNHYVLDLTSPLGSTQARVEGQRGSALLTRSNGTTLVATDPDALAEDALGSRVPVSGLRDWLRGRVSPAMPVQERTNDESGRLSQFGQGGWQVRLSRYDDLGPQLLFLERIEPGRRIVLRLVVNPN